MQHGRDETLRCSNLMLYPVTDNNVMQCWVSTETSKFMKYGKQVFFEIMYDV